MSNRCRGRCFCKAVSFEIDLPVQACVHCHCESCRRQCSAPFTTYIGVSDTQWRWTGKIPRIYQSSPGVERGFCDQCGSPVSFRSKKLSDVMHFYVLTLEDPEMFQPELHVAYEEKLAWLNVDDTMPKHNGPDYTKK